MEVNKIYQGKMEDVLKNFPDCYFDSCCTDPPYGLSFMGKKWDYQVPTIEQWAEAYRVLKPGAFMLVACGTRTQHRMVVNIEDAGFEIRDVITWHYGSGFPKSLDISKAIDKAAGVEREVVSTIKKAHISQGNTNEGWHRPSHLNDDGTFKNTMDITAPSTEAAKQWEGYGTALKPATEFWTLCRKPVEGTVAENVLKYGTGGLNIDGCRIGTEILQEQKAGQAKIGTFDRTDMITPERVGRFPANVIFDEFMGAELDKQSIANGIHSAGSGRQKMVDSDYVASSYNLSGERQMNRYEDGDNIGASRFFYCPKPDNFERNKGCEKLPLVQVAYGNQQTAELKKGEQLTPNAGVGQGGVIKPTRNPHPTVKPIDLMRYLVRLVTPKGGICLDPFCGSGTTLIAAKMELMNYIGIDMDETHIPLAEARVKAWNPDLYKPQELFK